MDPWHDNKCFCPLCGKYFDQSDYLQNVIPDKHALWIANMITHYRHTHISSWNKCWQHNGDRYRSKWFGDYETEKAKVNERAKRQIARKCKQYLLYHKFTASHFGMLLNQDPKTLQVVATVLHGKNYSPPNQLTLFQ